MLITSARGSRKQCTILKNETNVIMVNNCQIKVLKCTLKPFFLGLDLIDGRIFFLLSTKEIDGLERETEMQISERFARANSSCRDDNANEGVVNLHNDL